MGIGGGVVVGVWYLVFGGEGDFFLGCFIFFGDFFGVGDFLGVFGVLGVDGVFVGLFFFFFNSEGRSEVVVDWSMEV